MTVKPLANDCFVTDKDRMSLDEAWALLGELAKPVVDTEVVSLTEASGRILAEDLQARNQVPNVANAAVDGYAFNSRILAQSGPYVLSLHRERSAAGRPYTGPALDVNEAMRVLTGAAMPAGADTVVMQEDVEFRESAIAFSQGLKPGMNCRLAGEDMQTDDLVMHQGHTLRPQDLAVCAAAGYEKINVYKKLRLALVTGGDELRPAGQTLSPGQVIDSNAPMLTALYDHLPVEVTHGPIMSDEAGDVRHRLSHEARHHDCLVTVAAASQGDEDHVVDMVRELGQLNFWQIAMKPGRPLAFGMLDGSVFLGLPGNPIAAFVCSLLFVCPLIRALAGGTFQKPVGLPAYSGVARKKKAGRTEYLRGYVEAQDHRLIAMPVLPDGSGLTTVLSRAEGLIMIDEAAKALNKGDPVTFIPFSAYGMHGTGVGR